MTRKCTACGSEKIIPGVRILDEQGGASTDLHVVVYKSPESLLFKGRVYGTLRADVCGQCGHADLRVDKAEQLYDAYQEALKTGGQRPEPSQVAGDHSRDWQCAACGNMVPPQFQLCWNCGAAATATDNNVAK